MNKKTLEELCDEFDIKKRNHLLIKPEYYNLSEKEVNQAIKDLFKKFYDSLILIGGCLLETLFSDIRTLER